MNRAITSDWSTLSWELRGKVPRQASAILSVVAHLSRKALQMLPDLNDPLAGQKLCHAFRYPEEVCLLAVEQIRAALTAQDERRVVPTKRSVEATVASLPKADRAEPPPTAKPRRVALPPPPTPPAKSAFIPEAFEPRLAELDLVAEDMLCSMSDPELKRQALRAGVDPSSLTRGELVECLMKALET